MFPQASGEKNPGLDLRWFFTLVSTVFADGEGGEGENGEENGGEGSEGQEGDGSGGDGSESGQGEGSASSEGGESKDPRVKELSDENARRRVENRNLSKELDEAKKRLREIDDKDKSELEKAQRDLQELQDKVEPLTKELETTKAELAFFKADQARRFHDPADALREVDLTKITDEDGALDLKKLAKECDDLIKRKPYLARGEGDSSAEGDGSASGRPMNGPKTKSGSRDREALEGKFPALRGR